MWAGLGVCFLLRMLDIGLLGGVGRRGRRGKYSPLGGEVHSKEDKRIVPVPGANNNRVSDGIYDIGKEIIFFRQICVKLYFS